MALIETTGASPAAPPSPTRGNVPTSASEPAKPAGNQDAAFARIKQREAARERELLSLREEVAELRGRMSAPAPAAPVASDTPTSWEAMTDSQLSQAHRLAMEENNAAALDAVVNERVRRGVEKRAKAMQGEIVQGLEQRRVEENVTQKIVNEFGADALNQDSELYGLALKHYQGFIRSYGKDHVMATPHLRWMAVSQAHAELHADERVQNADARKELDALRRQQALERGGGGRGAPRTPESVEALKRGDLDGALLSSRLFQSFDADAKRARGG